MDGLSVEGCMGADRNERVSDVLDRTPLFAGLTVANRQALATIADTAHFGPGERIVAEGVLSQALFVVADGEVEVTRRVEAGSERHPIRPLGPGQTFGELGLLEELPASASVYARVPTTVLVIPLTPLRQMIARDSRFTPLYRGLAEQLNSRLRSLTDVTVQALEREVTELHARVTVGTLLIAIVAILTGFTFSLGLSRQLANAGLGPSVTLALCISALGAMGVVVRRSRLPLAFWGFTTRGWRPAVRDALLFSPPMIVGFLVMKWAMIRWVPGWEHVPFFHLQPLIDSGKVGDIVRHLAEVLAYVLLSVPLQEIVVRGFVQGTLEEFLVGSRRVLWAVVVSNLIFSVTHSYLSPQIAVLTLLPGVFWGWLYHRQRTLIDPIFSHLVIGVVAIEVIGILDLFH